MGNLGSTSSFYAGRPSITLDGRDRPGLSSGLLSLLVEETTAGLFRCEARFGNWGGNNGDVDFVYFDRRVLDFGKTIVVEAGEGDTAGRIFEGQITGLEAHYPQKRPPEILVLAEDRLQDLRMTRRTRSFEEVSDSDVMRRIASDHSLRPDFDLDGPTYPIVVQLNQSDLAFLRERARAINAEVWVEADTLRAVVRSRRDAGSITLSYGQGLLEFSVLADLTRQRSSLFVSGWDVAGKERIEHEATENVIRNELNGGQSGSAVLQSAFGSRAERIVHLVPLSLQETRSQAEAHYQLMARRFLTGQGIAVGDARIRVGSRVNLQGLGALFNGEFYVCEVRHTFEGEQGYRTYFRVERPALGAV